MARHRRPGRPRGSRARKYNYPQLDFQLNPDTAREISGIILIVLGIVLGISFFGIAGKLGSILYNILSAGFGYSNVALPFVALGLGVALLLPQKFEVKSSTVLGVIVFTASLATVVHIITVPNATIKEVEMGLGGGYVGYMLSHGLISVMGIWVTLIVASAALLVSILIIFNTSFAQIKEWFDGFMLRREKEESEIKVNEPEATKDPLKKPLFSQRFTKKEIKEEPEVEFKTTTIDKSWAPFPLTLLDDTTTRPDSGDVKASAAIIKKTLANFSIDVEMADVNVGPTVTQYTLKPATGVKLNKIVALNNDLALALAAHPLRIEAPIPGKSLVGIEVPNRAKSIVRLKGLLEDGEFKSKKSPLTVILGRDVTGSSIVANLDSMPHLLIAGSTGSGKSVCVNSIIMTLLYQNSPSDLKLILVDPKRVELPTYNGIPHLITPVITDHKKTVSALKWTVAEMERRYEVLSGAGARDIKSYNIKEKSNRMPYITVIIDELADLMAIAANEVESAIVRLAQMARATGIHLVVATQRPSVDVVTGLIKANITSRIAFAVASQVDSRTILDTAGAEKLLGNGDMLYISNEFGKPKRIQGVYTSDKEINNVADFIKKKGQPEYNEEVLSMSTKDFGLGGDGAGDDELFEEAAQLVIQAKKASASLLQRRLRVGYARAARLLDILEEKGIIGPADGARPRDVLVDHIEEERTEPRPSQVDQASDSDYPKSYGSEEEDKTEKDV